MRTYLTPIGFDTRRVTRPVVHNGIGENDVVVLLRPEDKSDTERAERAIADSRQLLQEIEPEVGVVVERVPTGELNQAILTCRALVDAAEGQCTVTLGGGPRDLLLPLFVAILARVGGVDQVLFYSDLDQSVREWTLPNLTACPPDRTAPTVETLRVADGPLSLSEVAEASDQSKSTVVRHVKDLAASGVVSSHHEGQTKYATLTTTGKLLTST